MPVQVIYGGKSPLSIHTVAKNLAQAIPKATLAELKGQDHMASPKVVLPLLATFFKTS
jgi:pimeloyl-ACP methyl ester carboxylesterase